MLRFAFTALLGALMLSGGASAAPEAPPAKPRLVVLTDIENEPDDTRSLVLVRLLLYANDIELRGPARVVARLKG
ncbi:nucleoside hydrolase-like domain-containing protein [Roseateles sp. P5_D6]